MDKWQATFLGLKQLPRELTAFELEAFFTFTAAERQVIEDRRGPELQLGLALQIGFLRMSGRVLDAVRMVPAVLWRHLGEQLQVAAPDLASLRAMYQSGNTLFEHQQLACEVLGFRWLSEPQRRALVYALRRELTRTHDRQRLLVFARRWLYDHCLIIMHERSVRSTIVSGTRQYEAALAKSIHAAVDDGLLERWRQALVRPRESGLSQQSWLWSAPAKHSTRQIEELLERIETPLCRSTDSRAGKNDRDGLLLLAERTDRNVNDLLREALEDLLSRNELNTFGGLLASSPSGDEDRPLIHAWYLSESALMPICGATDGPWSARGLTLSA